MDKLRTVAGVILLPVALVALVLLAVGAGLTLVYSKAALSKYERRKLARESLIKGFIKAAQAGGGSSCRTSSPTTVSSCPSAVRESE